MTLMLKMTVNQILVAAHYNTPIYASAKECAMDFAMGIHTFDLIISVIILLLGLKGVLNGFFKELFGLIGIVGGIFVASRVGNEVGTVISDTVFHFDSQSAITFSGFLVTLAIFWLSMVLIGQVLKKLVSFSGLGPVDRLFGFILGSGKFFLIAAVIAYSFNNIKALQDLMKEKMADSTLYPVLVEIGEIVVHIDPEDLEQSAEDAMQKVSESNNTIRALDQADILIDSVKERVGEAAQ